MLLLQLVYDLKEIPTLELIELNTDACMYMVDEKYVEQAHIVLHNWEDLTGLELEQDKIKKIVMRDVNNYVEIVQIGGNDYDVHYKGGVFPGKHKFKWDKEQKCFHYSFENDIKSNSLTIVAEAVLKKLLFDIPVEETINNCDDIFRFQTISHLGSTYEKCVQESENGDILLQRNNRIYAGKKPSGIIVKVKSDGRRDSLANCPPNPIVDNANELTINDINKEWYIEIANQRVNDFLGVKRLEEYKKDELVQMAQEMGLEFDKKIKKVDLIELIKNSKKEIKEQNNMNEFEKNGERNDEISLLKKIQAFRKKAREHEFVLDASMPNNLGGNDYVSIGQYYNFTQDTCLELGLDFTFEALEETRFEREIIKPSTGAPKHLSEVWCRVSLTDIDTGFQKCYEILGSGSDSIDKSLSSAEALAFRKWFEFNFTPTIKFDWEDEVSETSVSESNTQSEPKIPAYLPPKAKEEVKEKVVATEQHEDSDLDDIEKIAQMVMEIREATNNPDYAKEQIKLLQEGVLQTHEIDAIRVAIENTYFDVVKK